MGIQLMLFWYLPYATAFGIIGWLSELSEHFPMMAHDNGNPIYESRNRYDAWYERLIIGMHGDNFHLTHHLSASIPHWNLAAATRILREDDEFRTWMIHGGGIFSATKGRLSLIDFVITVHEFERPVSHAMFDREAIA